MPIFPPARELVTHNLAISRRRGYDGPGRNKWQLAELFFKFGEIHIVSIDNQK
jgi:hypothetical protein